MPAVVFLTSAMMLLAAATAMFLFSPEIASSPGCSAPRARVLAQAPAAPAPHVPIRARPGQLAPFDPTPREVIERMLVVAGVGQGDVLFDLGSGDGRMLVAGAKKYGAKAVGFEIDPALVQLSREIIERENLAGLVEVRLQDFMTADLSSATVVTLYLSQDGNAALKPLLLRQLRPGARVVSYTFDMGDWRPETAEFHRDAAGDIHPFYLWRIPPRTQHGTAD